MPIKKKVTQKVSSSKKNKKTVKRVSKISKKNVIKSKGDNWNKGSISKTKSTVRVNNRPTIIIRGGGGSAPSVVAIPPHPVPHPYGREFVADRPLYIQNGGLPVVPNGGVPPVAPPVRVLGGGPRPPVLANNNRNNNRLLDNPPGAANQAAVNRPRQFRAPLRVPNPDHRAGVAMEPQGLPIAAENRPSEIFNGRPRVEPPSILPEVLEIVQEAGRNENAARRERDNMYQMMRHAQEDLESTNDAVDQFIDVTQRQFADRRARIEAIHARATGSEYGGLHYVDKDLGSARSRNNNNSTVQDRYRTPLPPNSAARGINFDEVDTI